MISDHFDHLQRKSLIRDHDDDGDDDDDDDDDNISKPLVREYERNG